MLSKIPVFPFAIYLCILFSIGCSEDEAPSDYLDYQTIADLALPFSDEWYVVWGGRTLDENYHASLDDQRFAIDVVQFENGTTFTGNGNSNEDYHCYADTLFAPASGIVVELQDGVPENLPGETNKNQLFGNYVIIDHSNGEYSVLAHCITNSIQANVGEQVSQGQMIGLCGNSGNSTEPHLHYHMQNQPSILQGEGLPAQFQNYFADDVFVSRGEPLKGQNIRVN